MAHTRRPAAQSLRTAGHVGVCDEGFQACPERSERAIDSGFQGQRSMARTDAGGAYIAFFAMCAMG